MWLHQFHKSFQTLTGCQFGVLLSRDSVGVLVTISDS